MAIFMLEPESGRTAETNKVSNPHCFPFFQVILMGILRGLKYTMYI